MGNEQGSCQAQLFQMEEWQLTDHIEDRKVWRSRKDPSLRIQQYSIYTSNDQDHRYEENMYHFRKYHQNIVASYFIDSSSQTQFCSSSHSLRVFIEKIPIRLSDIQHIPFPDFLHIYRQALRGFQALSNYSNIGFFPVEEEYIGINDKGIVKVWLNQNYSRNYYIGSKVSEEFMVNSIIEIIEKNIDHSRIPRHVPSVRNYLYRNTDRLKFQQANQQFDRYLVQYHLGVPIGGVRAIQNRDKVANKVIGNQSKEFEINRNRPQLIDSQFLKNQYQILSPRGQSSHYIEVGSGERMMSLSNSQVVPNIQNNLLAPAVVRQNTPIVRKSATSYHQPINQFNTNVIYPTNNSNKSSAIQIQQRPIFNKPVFNKQNLPIRPIIIPITQVSQSQTIYRPLIIQRQNVRVRQENEAIKQSFIDLVQPQKVMHFQRHITTIQENFKSSNTIFSHQEVSQKIILPPSSPHQAIQPRSASSSFSRQTQRRPNSSY